MIRLVKVAVGLAVLLVAYIAFTFLQVLFAARSDHARPAQAIVVLGAAQYNGVPSSILKARLDHAYDLYARKLAPLVVVTGGKQPGDVYTEATASAEYLQSKGVPEDAILREVDGRNSWESLAAASEFLKDRDIHDVLLVSDPFHSYRIDAIASELGLHGHSSPTRTSPITGVSAFRHMLRETAAVSVGRIVGYRREAGIARRVEGQASSASGRLWSANRSAGALPDHSAP